jgi:hypothetical protein
MEQWPILTASIALAIPLVAQAVAAIRNVHEIRANREQRELELRWRKARMAKSVLDEIWTSPRCRAALTMLDWDGRDFEDAGRRTQPITHPVLVNALRVQETRFPADDQFVRDCFDDLFNSMARTEHFIRIGLIDFVDVEDRWTYYAKLLGDFRFAIEAFLEVYDGELAKALLDRFPEWRSAPRDGTVVKRRGSKKVTF